MFLRLLAYASDFVVICGCLLFGLIFVGFVGLVVDTVFGVTDLVLFLACLCVFVVVGLDNWRFCCIGVRFFGLLPFCLICVVCAT